MNAPPRATSPRWAWRWAWRWPPRTVLVAAGAVLGCGAARPPEGSIAAVLVRDPESGRVVVREVPAGRAAAVAGLAPDDQLKMVDGVHVDDLDAASLVRALRGPVGSAVTLTVVRGPAVREVEVRREPRGRRVEAVPERGRLE